MNCFDINYTGMGPGSGAAPTNVKKVHIYMLLNPLILKREFAKAVNKKTNNAKIKKVTNVVKSGPTNEIRLCSFITRITQSSKHLKIEQCVLLWHKSY